MILAGNVNASGTKIRMMGAAHPAEQFGEKVAEVGRLGGGKTVAGELETDRRTRNRRPSRAVVGNPDPAGSLGQADRKRRASPGPRAQHKLR